jgi:hypothetical protein
MANDDENPDSTVPSESRRMGAAGIRRNVNPGAIRSGVSCMTAGNDDANAGSRSMTELTCRREAKGRWLSRA